MFKTLKLKTAKYMIHIFSCHHWTYKYTKKPCFTLVTSLHGKLFLTQKKPRTIRDEVEN